MTSHGENTYSGLIIAIPRHVSGLQTGGLPIPVRLTRQFRKAGVGGPVVWVVSSQDDRRFWENRATRENVVVHTPQTLIQAWPPLQSSRLVWVPGDLVFSGEGLSKTLADRRGTGVTPSGWGMIPAGDAQERLKEWAVSVCAGMPAVPPRKDEIHVPEQKYSQQVTDCQSARDVEYLVLKNLKRDQDPNFPRLTGRRFSNGLSLLAARWGMSANMVTASAITTGLIGVLMILKAQYAWVLAGALLLMVSRILDDCDGAVARMTFQESKFGAVFDITGDIVVYLGVFLALGFGLHRSDPSANYLWAMGLLLFGGAVTTVLLLIFVTGTRMREHSSLVAFLERTASGDVAYIFFPFALANITGWFLWASAVGAQVYWMVLAAAIFLQLRK